MKTEPPPHARHLEHSHGEECRRRGKAERNVWCLSTSVFFQTCLAFRQAGTLHFITRVCEPSRDPTVTAILETELCSIAPPPQPRPRVWVAPLPPCSPSCPASSPPVPPQPWEPQPRRSPLLPRKAEPARNLASRVSLCFGGLFFCFSSLFALEGVSCGLESSWPWRAWVF